ncbi:GDP-L-fucose synthase [Paraburkholderia domus]|uniref:GDP-L-fucose synthase n=1 Tax=Paraburkholderia domus TaxID=2793075 RepID=A0A9N8MP62_9BURK|nr:GDP-L-fucose synthase [Paraburkholderia domus]MBK5052578.1 GDP-L-fucose synthase [Burkholderia sp. R-70006]MBK5059572.1 GDP-L-fucose synthase [Burkholderia sp. R-70199]MBK5090813.1 GDP-L-fucose synthase [Burkholderia sp. R-69927]MBK5123150.1 GDP-L-fucose synthase [Burkholderia sp. R-69980]MBK5165011.1 GDP-L-fucose synthase [Burkholderia sp. R-70211]MBK5182313.1 GDP-L-fucose synthase [Burkholderia sp. R-69749]MCI0151553.1 GDP-L-fucose synthase [Paraburkholderia sediminicola]
MNKQARIFVAGHRGMVGSALVRRLNAEGYHNVVTRTRAELDLMDQAAVNRFFEQEGIDVVLLAAARVGGILANASQPGEFIYENLVIETNVIHAAYRAQVERLVFFGSSCIYPKQCPQPIREEYLLTSPLEPTNDAYAIAKIAGLKLCEAYNREYNTQYVSLMPTNLYGPNDNYDLNSSHVLPALLKKAHEAKVNGSATLTVWGSGTPRREFLHVDDLAAATLFVLEHNVTEGLFNVGVGEDLSIRELAECICRVAGFEGELVFDASKPDGTPRKLLDVSRLAQMGWHATIGLEEGIASTYREFVELHAGSTPAAAMQA